jgi:hypothetical protein
MLILFHNSNRVLSACLKYLAKCPCPRCLILKSKIPRLGTVNDMRDRELLERVDDEHLQWDIELVRKKIFVKGMGIGSNALDHILAEKSVVPTQVYHDYLLNIPRCNTYLFAECLLAAPLFPWSQFLPALRARPPS